MSAIKDMQGFMEFGHLRAYGALFEEASAVLQPFVQGLSGRRLKLALEILGDRYAVCGFSGWSRKRCDAFRTKTFESPMYYRAKAAIGGIAPKDYTRMGAPVRHFSRMLQQAEARTKLPVTISDGKPDDYDHYYRGGYGIEDTRQALFEARISGIHPFCITIDKEGAEYLPHMYGQANYVVLDDVAKLPLKISDIYRKITS